MSMKNPAHPGRIVKLDCLAPLNLTVTPAAGIWGVSRQALNNVADKKAGISAEMAIRLEMVFGGADQLRSGASASA